MASSKFCSFVHTYRQPKKAKQQWQSQRRDFGLWQNRLPWLEFSLSRPHKAVIEGKFFARIAIIIEDQCQGRRNYVEGQRARATCPLSFFRNRSKTCSFKKSLDYVLISPYPYRILYLPTALWSHWDDAKEPVVCMYTHSGSVVHTYCLMYTESQSHPGQSFVFWYRLTTRSVLKGFLLKPREH